MYLDSPRDYCESYVKCVFSSFECTSRQEHINNGFRNVETSKIWLFPPAVQIPCAQGEMNSESFVVYSFDKLYSCSNASWSLLNFSCSYVLF